VTSQALLDFDREWANKAHDERWHAERTKVAAQADDADGLPGTAGTPPVRGPVPAPEPEWDAFGVLPPQPRTEGAAEVDVMDFIAQGDDDDKEEWLVEGLFPKHGLTVVGGNPKNGKTLWVLDLCFAVATGRQFFGRETAEMAFLFVTEEGAPAVMRGWMRRLVRSSGPRSGPVE
jgi:hypothetical protein